MAASSPISQNRWVVLRSHQLIARVGAGQAQPPRLGLKVRQGTHGWPRVFEPTQRDGEAEGPRTHAGDSDNGPGGKGGAIRPGAGISLLTKVPSRTGALSKPRKVSILTPTRRETAAGDPAVSCPDI